MSPRTVFLGKLIGLYYLIASLAMFAHKSDIVKIEDTLIHSPATLFVAGIFTLLAGLAMVLGHNVWSGGALPVIVTLVGWITLVKGVLFLSLSPEAAVGLWGSFHYGQLFYLYATICLVLGGYLTYASFTTSTPRSGVAAPTSTPAPGSRAAA